MGARYIAELVCKAVSRDSDKLGRDQWDVLAQVSRALGLTINPIAIATANEITLPIKATMAPPASASPAYRCQPTANLSATHPPINTGR